MPGIHAGWAPAPAWLKFFQRTWPKQQVASALSRKLVERLAAAERSAEQRLAAAERASAERLAEKSERLAAAERSAEQRLAAAAKLLEAVERSSGIQQAALKAELAQAKYVAGIARGMIARQIPVRCVLDTSLAEVFRMSVKTSPGGSKFMGGTQMLSQLLSLQSPCPGLQAYLTVAAEDNGLQPEQVLRHAKAMYVAMSQPLHAEDVGSTALVQLPADLFELMGKPTVVAYAALLRFSGRSLRLYLADDSSAPPVLLRPPPVLGCSATAESVRELEAESPPPA